MLDAVEVHRGAGDQGFGVGGVAVEQRGRPPRVAAGEAAQRGRISEAALGGDPAADDAVQGRPLELARVGLERVAAVAFLVGPRARRKRFGRRGGNGRVREQDRREDENNGLQPALPVRTTMIRLVPDSGR